MISQEDATKRFKAIIRKSLLDRMLGLRNRMPKLIIADKDLQAYGEALDDDVLERWIAKCILEVWNEKEEKTTTTFRTG